MLKRILNKLKKIFKSDDEKKYIKLLSKSKYFDSSWYINKYNIDKKINPYEHYFYHGWIKNYDPSRMFSTKKYLENNPNVQICPLLDYEIYKKENNRKVNASNIIYEGKYYEKKYVRLIKRKLSEIINFRYISKNKNKKILVILHIFYYYSFKEIKEYLKNLDCYNYDLIVTIVDDAYDKNLKEEIQRVKKDAKILKYPNKGFDISSFICEINKVDLDNYDLIFKLQSKGTNNGTRFVYNQIFKNRDWFVNLYEGILGAFNVHKNIYLISNNDNIGMISSKNLIVDDPIHKKHLLKSNLEMLKLKYIDNYKYNAGACFIIKPKLLEPVKKLSLTINDFNDTRRTEFSFAHIMERYICFEIFNQNKEIYGVDVCKYRRLRFKKVEKELRKLSALNILNDNRFIISDDYAYFSLEGRFISNYYLGVTKIKNIKREWYGKYYKLQECSPYKYLEGDIKSYDKYVKYHEEHNWPIMSKKRYDDLINSIKKYGYNKKYPIVINQKDDSILDGQHRTCIMLKLNGENCELPTVNIDFLNVNLEKIKPFSKKIFIETSSGTKVYKKTLKIAVQIHVYYTDLLPEIYENIKKIDRNYDLYISTDTQKKKEEIDKFFCDKNIKYFVEVFENKGRDILPFLSQMRYVLLKYDYICHIHTKKSKYSDFGDSWRKYLYSSLFSNTKKIFRKMQKGKIGIVFPKPYEKIKNNMEMGSNLDIVNEICSRLGINNSFKNIFPAGSMFWIRSDILSKLCEVISADDFDEEDGQIDGTYAHAIERIFVILSESCGYKYYQI